MRRHRIWPVALVVPGVLLIAGSFGFKSWVLPEMTKFPTNLDVNAAYEGTVTLYVDPATKAPLAEPQVLPLSVERSVKADADLSTGELVVVRETLNLKSPGLFDSVQEHQYVMDRETHANVAGPEAWAYNSLNPVDRAGAFYVSFGMRWDTAQGMPVYKGEIDGTYVASPAGTSEIDGLEVATVAAAEDWTPVVDAYLSDLDRSMALPRQLTLDEMKPLLAGQGLDLDAVLTGLLPKLTPEDLQSLLLLAGQPIPLQYLQRFEGTTSVDPITGAPVDVSDVSETLGAVPADAWVGALTTTLAKYPDVPEAVTLKTAVESTATNPIPIFANDYRQTEASVAEAVADAKENGNKLHLGETVIPNTMLFLGLGMTVLGLVLILIPRRGEGGHEPEHDVPPPAPAEEAEDTSEKELVHT
jgi:hypothetical protein